MARKNATKKIRKTSSRKATKTVRARGELIDTKSLDLVMPAFAKDPAVRNFWKTPSFYIGLVVIALVALLAMNKSWWLAAVVNGKPVYRWDFNRVMTLRFGAQTLENMISEQLIAEEGAKSGITISQKDVDAKVQEIVKGLGENVKIEDLLKFQGMTKVDFEKQLRLQMMMEKILAKDLTITDEDVANYIASNSALMTATDEAALKTEAREAIRSQKIGEKMQTWFTQLKEKAKILRFL